MFKDISKLVYVEFINNFDIISHVYLRACVCIATTCLFQRIPSVFCAKKV